MEKVKKLTTFILSLAMAAGAVLLFASLVLGGLTAVITRGEVNSGSAAVIFTFAATMGIAGFWLSFITLAILIACALANKVYSLKKN